MGLAEELKQAKSGEVAKPQIEQPQAQPAPAEPAPNQMSFEMSDQNQLTEQLAQANPAEAIPQEPKLTPETKITIGDKEFTNQQEAIAYAQEIERQRIVSEAYKKGILDAQPKDQIPDKPAIEEQIQDMLFENPAEALKLYREEIEREITSKITTTQTKQEQEKQMWSGFYESNQDLSNHRDLVEFVLERNWSDIAHIDLDKGLKVLADNARKILTSYKEEAKPREELKSGPAVVPGASQAPAPTVEAAPQKPLDFIEQVKKHKNRTLGEEMERLGIKK